LWASLHSRLLPDALGKPSEPDPRGDDIHTGKLLWKFNLVPQQGEFGADTWKNGTAIDTWGRQGRRVGFYPRIRIWALSYSGRHGLSDEYGGHRPGANLFANSVVAIDVKTGKRKWHFQMVHHDIWDCDAPMSPNLLDITVNGRLRKVVGRRPSRAGSTFDRETGEPIWPMPETVVL
jgi:quinoprotein glucose dehydrogenase